ncbi:hypothetical protein [Cellulomonas timonensis]|uniref:hypothetical protein n=1 Tax=Cellulomonas timonensis TaxID=1689271 RepID=UPI00131B9929|nr:hypothetical protein [Cellulomonas timonensis]
MTFGPVRLVATITSLWDIAWLLAALLVAGTGSRCRDGKTGVQLSGGRTEQQVHAPQQGRLADVVGADDHEVLAQRDLHVGQPADEAAPERVSRDSRSRVHRQIQMSRGRGR